MPVFTPTVGTGPRQELSLAIVEGEGAVRNLIGDKIMPLFPINKRTAHLPKLTLQDTLGMRMISDTKFLRAPGTKYERMIAKVSDATIGTDLRGAEIIVPNETSMEWAEYLDLLAYFSAKFGNEISGLTKEFFIASAVMNVSNTYRGSAMNSSVAYTAANRDIQGALGMNPVQDIIAAARYIKGTGESPDFVAMSGPVWERVSTAQNTLQFVKGYFNGITEVNLDNFTKALKLACGIEEVLIGDSYYNSASDGVTPSLVQLWNNNYMAVGRRGMSSYKPEDEEGVGVPTLAGIGVNAYWEGFAPGGKPSIETGSLEMYSGNYVETYPSMDINSMIIRVGMSAKPFFANIKCLVLIATQYA